jgi:ATP phosphoribosyltransferase
LDLTKLNKQISDYKKIQEDNKIISSRFNGNMIMTKYPNLTESFFLSKGVSQFRVVPSLGATESYPFTGSSELITDITSTGSTLKANNLRIVNDGIMLKSSACIFVSKKIEKNKFLNLLK